MFARLLTLAALVALSVAREYPAGVHPAVCPNYPFCDTEALARHSPDGTPIPEWVRNPNLLPVGPQGPVPVGPLGPAGFAPAAAAPRYPADFPAALCPNYPYCW